MSTLVGRARWAVAVPALIALAAAAKAGGGVGFHAPNSPAEMALDRAVKAADRDDSVLDNLLHRYPVAAAKRIDYRSMLTGALIAAMQTREHALVAKDCGGKYLDGEICGMDYNPITCAQDTVAPYRYKTAVQHERDATITGPGATYRMVLVDSVWKLDGIQCDDGDAFNFR